MMRDMRRTVFRCCEGDVDTRPVCRTVAMAVGRVCRFVRRVPRATVACTPRVSSGAPFVIVRGDDERVAGGDHGAPTPKRAERVADPIDDEQQREEPGDKCDGRTVSDGGDHCAPPSACRIIAFAAL